MPRLQSRPPPAASPLGYTLVELVVVIAIAATLAAFVGPRFWTQSAFSTRGYADELAVALRVTQKAAVVTGCPAQLTVTATAYVANQQAAVGNTCDPNDNGWSMPLLGADGSAIQDSAPSGTNVSPTGVFRFNTMGALSSSPGTMIAIGTHTVTIDPVSGLVQVQ
jgi:prepilin-type N-terminal cleavage/methylation domain-containing protein